MTVGYLFAAIAGFCWGIAAMSLWSWVWESRDVRRRAQLIGVTEVQVLVPEGKDEYRKIRAYLKRNREVIEEAMSHYPVVVRVNGKTRRVMTVPVDIDTWMSELEEQFTP